LRPFHTVIVYAIASGVPAASAQHAPTATRSAATSRPTCHPLHLCVRDFGASGDGRTLDTLAIQRAIDATAKDGGTVWFGPGRYLSGTLLLRSRVTLRLDGGATLLASTDLNDYRTIAPRFNSRTNVVVCPSLIYAENAQDVAITGGGAIDGQGAAFKAGPGRIRPFVLRFVTCRNVRVEGVTLRNSPGWMQHYLACDDVAIRGIRVLSHANYNNDMMDIDCCRNVRISDCFGDTGDDAITLKSTGDRACENVTITNCIVSSHCNAIKCGTESNGGFKNITISNCVIHPSASEARHHGVKGGLAGIALEMVDGGTLEQVAISNITMTGVQAPIFMRLGNRAHPVLPDSPKPGIGTFRNVTLSNILATDAGDLGCAIAGIPGHPIENVTLNNILVTMAGGGTAAHASAAVPEKAEASPECTMFGTLPAYGFYCRHVAGLRLHNIHVQWSRPDLRSALICDDVQDLEIHALRGQSSPAAAPVIVLNDVRRALIRDCTAPSDTSVFLRMRGRTDQVSATGNDLSSAATPFDFGAGVSPTVLHQTGNRMPSPPH
jgi:polygalacturonase